MRQLYRLLGWIKEVYVFGIERKLQGGRTLFDTGKLSNSLLQMLGLEPYTRARIIDLQGARINLQRVVQLIGCTDHTIPPGRALLNEHGTSDWPVILAATCIVVRLAAEIGAQSNNDLIGEPACFGGVENIGDQIGYLIQRTEVIVIVILMCIEPTNTQLAGNTESRLVGEQG